MDDGLALGSSVPVVPSTSTSGAKRVRPNLALAPVLEYCKLLIPQMTELEIITCLQALPDSREGCDGTVVHFRCPCLRHYGLSSLSSRLLFKAKRDIQTHVASSSHKRCTSSCAFMCL